MISQGHSQDKRVQSPAKKASLNFRPNCHRLFSPIFMFTTATSTAITSTTTMSTVMKRPRIAVLDLCNPVSCPHRTPPRSANPRLCLTTAGLCHQEDRAPYENFDEWISWLYDTQTETHQQPHRLPPNSSEPLAAPLQPVETNQKSSLARGGRLILGLP
ncbi:hypothetical protein CPB83DRAFT_851410 [Crepidotus variabilis]|uniref:Uncharacterized protein n=1 Tax=Crepidotus variabilis TaxID=179855 RepID=A0A9P6JRQ4_9AGAR|nr:hypothetical protein CPB83DRAFT_851410 [Crepidotus variabilis]